MSDNERVSREELDKLIEWLIEVQFEPREKLKDEDDAYEEIMWLYKVSLSLLKQGRFCRNGSHSNCSCSLPACWLYHTGDRLSRLPGAG